MITIYDGRTEFVQWDSEQRLVIDPSLSCSCIHMGNSHMDETLVVEIYEEDGKRICNVPNILLTEPYKLVVYAFCTSVGRRTTYRKEFIVREKEKPADYVYTETEVRTYERLDHNIEELRKLYESLDIPVAMSNMDIEEILST